MDWWPEDILARASYIVQTERGGETTARRADMILFDPQNLGVSKMERHFDLPAGGERLLRTAPGLLGTWVNGVQVFDGQDYLAHSHGPGQVITEFSPDAPTVGMGESSLAAE